MIFETTPSQTVGPYYAIGLPWGGSQDVVPAGTPGAITLHGSVYDGRGVLIPDHLIETWQADPEGRFADLHGAGGPSTLAGFRGFGRCGYESGDGTYSITTVKPGRVPVRVAGQDDEVLQAPHVDVSLFARGLLERVVTRIYFGDEAQANATDPVLKSVPDERRATLIAQPDGDGSYRFDIRLQGEGETVFFAV